MPLTFQDNPEEEGQENPPYTTAHKPPTRRGEHLMNQTERNTTRETVLDMPAGLLKEFLTEAESYTQPHSGGEAETVASWGEGLFVLVAHNTMKTLTMVADSPLNDDTTARSALVEQYAVEELKEKLEAIPPDDTISLVSETEHGHSSNKLYVSFSSNNHDNIMLLTVGTPTSTRRYENVADITLGATREAVFSGAVPTACLWRITGKERDMNAILMFHPQGMYSSVRFTEAHPITSYAQQLDTGCIVAGIIPTPQLTMWEQEEQPPL